MIDNIKIAQFASEEKLLILLHLRPLAMFCQKALILALSTFWKAYDGDSRVFL